MKLSPKLFIAAASLYLSINAQEALIPHKLVEGHLASYTEGEKKNIALDHYNIEDLCFKNAKPEQEKHYLATAGGPGSGKSTILERYMAENNLGHYVYADPDQRSLVYMINTYMQSRSLGAISKAESFRTLLENAYTQWRGASNYIASSILNKAFEKGFSIAHGTTSTGKGVPNLYDIVKKADYKITLLLCASHINNQKAAIEHRETTQALVQSTSEDFVEKTARFYEMMPTYFKYADTLELYWTKNFADGFVHVASYSKKDGFKKLHKDYEMFEKAYEDYRIDKNNSLPTLKSLLETSK